MSGRFLALWNARTPRERVMLGAMFVVIGAVLVWLAVLRPLADMTSAARERHGEAVAALAEAREQAAAIKALERGAGGTVQGALEPIVGRAASGAGFQLGGLQPAGDGRVAVAIPAARPQALFGWLAQLEAGEGLLVERMEASSNTDKSLSVQVTLKARGR